LLKVPDESTQSPDGHVALAAGREAQTVRRVQEAGQRLRPLHLLTRLGTKILSLRQELEGLARLPELRARPQPLPPHAGQAAGQEGEGGGGEAAPLVQHLGRRVVGGQRPEAGEVLVVDELAEVEEADGGVNKGYAVARFLAAAAFIDGQQIPKWRSKYCLGSVLRIRIRIRIHVFLGLQDPDPLVKGMDPDPDPVLDPDPDPSIIMQK
jgi:hypothetical protein